MRNGNMGNRYDEEEYKFSTKKNKMKKQEVKTSHVISMFIWLAIFAFVVYQVYILVMYTLGKKDKEKMWLYNTVNNVIGIFNKDKSSVEESCLKFAGVGDIYLTTTMINASKTNSGYNFSTGTENIKEKLSKFDVVVGSLSTPITDNLNTKFVSTKKAGYIAPSNLIDTLKSLNISVLATATNHSLDENEDGIKETIDVLENKGINQIGLNKSKDNIVDPIVIDKNNIKLGILSYTTKSEVKLSEKNSYLINILDEEQVKKDVEYLKDKKVDFIISYLCIPNEDSNFVSNIQKQSVDILVNNGVNVVLGTGSNVPQEYFEDQLNINGNNNHVYAIYSLGDFFGAYEDNLNRTNVIANLEFTKKVLKNKKGEIVDTKVNMKTNKPIFLWTELSSKNIKTIYVITDDMINNNSEKLSKTDYANLKKAYERLTTLFEK